MLTESFQHFQSDSFGDSNELVIDLLPSLGTLNEQLERIGDEQRKIFNVNIISCLISSIKEFILFFFIFLFIYFFY